MTVPSSSNRMEYTGNGVASSFDYTFKIFADTDLQVYVLDTDGVQTQLVLTTDFTVSGAGDPDGGSITLTAGALTSGYGLVILREVPLTQEVDLRNQGAYYPETVETMGDRLMMGIQQLAEKVTRTLQFRPSDDRTTAPKTNQLPVPQTGYALSWDSDGNLENVQLAAINYDIIITGGDAGKVIKVNATEDGIDVGATYTDSNTVSTIIQRDASGRAKVSDPSAAQDIATKNYVDNFVAQPANIGAAVPIPVLLSNTAITAVSSIDLATVFSDNPSYRYFMVSVEGASKSSGTESLCMRVSIDGSTFRNGALDYQWAYSRQLGTSATLSTTNAASGTFIEIGVGRVPTNNGDTQIRIVDPHNTSALKAFYFDHANAPGNTVVAREFGVGGFMATFDDITGVQLFWESGGTFTATGSIKVYGSNAPF